MFPGLSSSGRSEMSLAEWLPAAVLLTMSAYVRISEVAKFMLRPKVSIWALATPNIRCIEYIKSGIVRSLRSLHG